MNADVIAQLIERAKSDADFRASAVKDLEGTLASNGYELDEEQLDLVREFHSRVAGLSDAEILETLDPEVAGHAG